MPSGSGSREPLRQWFVPGEGIDRHVITTDLQRYLGPDATVRPGPGTGQQSGVQGYWIKAYRTLTSEMIADLRQDTARWRQEQRTTGTRDGYIGSTTYVQSRTTGSGSRRDRDDDSPAYGGVSQPRGGERAPTNSRFAQDRMDIDPPQQPTRNNGGYGSQDRGGYQQDVRMFPPEQQQPPMHPYNSRAPVTSSYDPQGTTGYPQGYPQAQAPQNGRGTPPGMVRSGNFYVPIPGYGAAGQPSSQNRPDVPSFPSNPPYGQPQAPQGRADPRYTTQPQADYARDPRYTQQDYDPRNYPNMPPQYDQFGRTIEPPAPQRQSDVYASGSRDPNVGRESQRDRERDRERERDRDRPSRQVPSSSDRDRDTRRRR